jgi:heterodisulfide reductase subunit A-like polyferredoxin
VASCTPRTHEGLFQDSIRQAGLNPYLFEMANIRNQVSWVHSNNWDAATEKAKELVHMSVARATRLHPLHMQTIAVQQRALVIGGGVAGMSAALALSGQGFPVDLVERTRELGGNLRRLYFMANGQRSTVNVQLSMANGQRQGERLLTIDNSPLTTPALATERSAGASVDHSADPQAFLADLLQRVADDAQITVHLHSELLNSTGFTGNFTSTLRTSTGGTHTDTVVQHGVTIIATGGQEYKGHDYGYGTNERILTGLEFEAMLAQWSEDQEVTKSRRATGPEWRRSENQRVGGSDSEIHRSSFIIPPSVAFILCVGPAEKYCGRTCCTSALKQAIKLKEISPDTQVTMRYRDIRTYGFKERLYTQARALGVVFMRYDEAHRPEVRGQRSEVRDQRSEVRGQSGSQSTDAKTPVADTLEVRAWEPTFGEWVTLTPDLLVLSMPMAPAEGSHELGLTLKVPLDLNGWFLEAHPKLRPVDFASDGYYMAGAAHYPKFVDEAIVQAQAAAARAATVLSRETMTVGGAVAQVNPDLCVGCLTCVRICPYGVPAIQATLAGVGHIQGAATINPAMCHGCGICMAECPARAIELMHYTDEQVEIKIEALFGLEKLARVPASGAPIPLVELQP